MAWEDLTGAVRETIRPGQGCNFDVTFLVAERGRFVVKTGDTPEKLAWLEREGEVLDALAAYRPFVPASLGRDGDRFLFSYVEGADLSEVAGEPLTRQERDHLAAEYGRALRTIHGWQAEIARPQDWLADAVAQCRENVASGAIADTVRKFNVHAGRPVRELLAWLEERQQDYACEVRLCHGDWCLPNVLITGGAAGRVTAAVDWSGGGYADYRYDMATGLWSLRRNGLAGHEGAFRRGYGYDAPPESLDWFEALYALR